VGRHLILLTSFLKARMLPVAIERLSVAVYQPKGFVYPKLDFFDIRDEAGKWTRPRDFLGENHDASKPDALLLRYRAALIDIYTARLPAILQWRSSLKGDVALCCWCPYDEAAQRQLKDYGSFVCHTSVIGFMLDDGQIEIKYDVDRQKMVRW
jgi:hypothetical protein